MPQFWGNSNNSGTPYWDKRNAAEINAITEFLWSISKPKELPAGRTNGNAAAGKQLVETVGCFGCHAIGAIQEVPNQSQIRRRHGFNLENQGSKVTPSWLYNWVKDPAQVWPETKMPSLRLTPSQAQRLFGLEPSTCVAILETLLNEHFLFRTKDGLFQTSAR